MEVIHIAQNTDGYEIVTLIANRISRKNHLTLIEKDNGEQHMTGGFILENTPEIRAVLDSVDKSKQYNFVKSIKVEPVAKLYYEE